MTRRAQLVLGLLAGGALVGATVLQARAVQTGIAGRRSRRCPTAAAERDRRRGPRGRVSGRRGARRRRARGPPRARARRGRRARAARASCSPRSTRTSCAPSSRRRARAWSRPRPRCGCPRRPSRAASSSSSEQHRRRARPRPGRARLRDRARPASRPRAPSVARYAALAREEPDRRADHRHADGARASTPARWSRPATTPSRSPTCSRLRIEGEAARGRRGRRRPGRRRDDHRRRLSRDAPGAARSRRCPDSVTLRRIKPQDPSRPTDARVLAVKVAFAEPVPLRLGHDGRPAHHRRASPADARSGRRAVWAPSLARKRRRRYARSMHETQPRHGGLRRRRSAARCRAGARAGRIRRSHRHQRRPRPVLLRRARRRRAPREEPLVPAEHRGRSRRRRHADRDERWSSPTGSRRRAAGVSTRAADRLSTSTTTTAAPTPRPGSTSCWESPIAAASSWKPRSASSTARTSSSGLDTPSSRGSGGAKPPEESVQKVRRLIFRLWFIPPFRAPSRLRDRLPPASEESMSPLRLASPLASALVLVAALATSLAAQPAAAPARNAPPVDRDEDGGDAEARRLPPALLGRGRGQALPGDRALRSRDAALERLRDRASARTTSASTAARSRARAS